MDYDTLKEFICLAKYLNFSEAAFNLHMSQPTLSRHIANLEYQLDAKLFNRNKSYNFLTLTEAGEMFLEDAQKIIDDFDRAVYRIHTVNEGYKGGLVVGYRRIYHSPLWNNLVYEFANRYPEINADYHSDNDLDRIYNKLLQNQYDIAFSVGMKEYENPVFQSFELMKTSLLAVVNVSHPLADEESVSFSQLSSCRLILPSPDNHLGFSDIINDLCIEHDISPEYYANCRTIEDAEFYVTTQSAVNIVPKCYFSQTETYLRAKEIEGTKDAISMYGIYKKENDNPSLKTFVHFVKKELLAKSADMT